MGETDGYDPGAPLTPTDVGLLGSDEGRLHRHRLMVTDECRRRMQDVPDDKACWEAYENIVMYAYDKGREYLAVSGLPDEGGDDEVTLLFAEGQQP